MCRKQGFDSVSYCIFNLPGAAVRVQCWENSCVSQLVNALVIYGMELEVAYGYCVALSVVNTEYERTVVFGAKSIGDVYKVWAGSMTSSSSIFATTFDLNSHALGSVRYGAERIGRVSSGNIWSYAGLSQFGPGGSLTWIQIMITYL